MSGISRRRLLRAASLSALGLALSTAVTPSAVAGPGGRTWDLAPRSAALRALDPARPQYQPVGPLTITATHSLSNDAFVSSELQLNLTGENPDQLVPITRADGRVEALVLSTVDNLLYLLHRDPSATGGWRYDAVYSANDGTTGSQYLMTSFTAAYDPTDGNVHLVIRKLDQTWGSWFSVMYMGEDNVVQGSQMTPYTLNGSSNGGWWCYASSSAPPRYFLDAANVPTFYLWDDAATYYTVERQVAPGTQPIATLTPNALVGFPVPTVADGRISTADGLSFVALSVDGSSGGILCPFGGVTTVGQLPAGTDIEWAGVIPTAQGPSTAFLTSDTDGTTLTYFQSSGDDSETPQTDQPVPLPDGATLASVTSSNNQGASQLYFVLGGADPVAGQLWTMISGLAGGTPNFAAIPVDTGFSAVYAPDLLTDDVTLFAVLDDGATVRILSRSNGSASSFYAQPLNGLNAPDNPVDGPWTAVPVHLPATTASQVDTWRTSIRLTDAFGAVQAGVPITVAVDRDVTIWQPGGTDAAGQPIDAVTGISAAGPPATFTTDGDGEVTLAVPAAALHTATYTVTAPDGTSAVLAPDGDVHARLADLTTLPLAMQNAQAADGSPLFGALQPAPGDGTAGSAAVQAATFVAQAMSIGLGLTPPTPSAALAVGGLGSADTLRLSTGNPAALDAVGSLRSLWDKAKHDAESVVRAVETAAVQVADDVETAATLVQDAATGLYQVSLQLAGDFDDVVTWAVSDARSAVAAVTGLFHTLVNDADKGLHDIVHWLKDDVLGLFRDAADAAGDLAALITGDDADTALRAVVGRWKAAADTDFDILRDDVTATFAQVSSFLSGQTLTTMRGQVPAPSGSTAQADATMLAGAAVVADTGLTQKLADVVHDVRGQWLRDKLKHQTTLPPAISDDVDTPLQKLLDDLGTGVADLLADFKAVALDVVGLAGDGTQASVADGDLGKIFTDVGAFIDEFFTLAKTLVDDLLGVLLAIWDEIRGVLSQTLDQVFPDAAPIMDLIGLGGVNVAQVLAIFITMPGTLFARIRFGRDATMFTTTEQVSTGVGDDPTDWTSFIATAGLLSTFFWGIVDGTVDVARLAAQAAGETYEPPAFVAWTDLGFSFFSNMVSYPFSSTFPLSWVPENGTTKYPNLPVGVWAAGFAPSILGAIGTAVASRYGEPTKTTIGRVQTVIISAVGVALTVLNSYTTWKTAPSSDSDASKAIAVTGNLTNVMAPLGLFADETLAISDVVKVVFDIACPIISFGSGLALLEKST